MLRISCLRKVEQHKLLALEKWEIAQEKAALQGELKQLKKLIIQGNRKCEEVI